MNEEMNLTDQERSQIPSKVVNDKLFERLTLMPHPSEGHVTQEEKDRGHLTDETMAFLKGVIDDLKKFHKEALAAHEKEKSHINEAHAAQTIITVRKNKASKEIDKIDVILTKEAEEIRSITAISEDDDGDEYISYVVVFMEEAWELLVCLKNLVELNLVVLLDLGKKLDKEKMEDIHAMKQRQTSLF